MMKRIWLLILVSIITIGAFSLPVSAEFKQISVGSDGKTVSEIQERLVELGYLIGSVDGSFGPKTEKAVIVYQAKNGIEPTGIVDEKTYKSMMEEESESVSFEEVSNNGWVLPLTSQQLLEYSEELIGYRFDTVVKLGGAYSDYLYSDENGSKSFFSYNYEFNFDNVDNLDEKYSEDQTVEVVGFIEAKSYGGYSYEHCEVVSEGTMAEGKRKAIEKSSDNSMKVIDAISSINRQKEEKAREDEVASYKEQCESLDYNGIMRNPDNYDGRKCKIHGEVLQVSEGWFSITLRVAENGDYDRAWYVNYSYSDNEDHILEDDWVTIYGECDGTTTYTALLGNKVTIPEVDAEYIVID